MKRWFQSRTIWLNLIAMIGNFFTAAVTIAAGVAPEALLLLPTIGLEPKAFMAATISINTLINGANMWLRARSPSALGTKLEVEAANDWVERSGAGDL